MPGTLTAKQREQRYHDKARMLRRFFTGFDKASGYDLRKKLTPAQKRLITIHHEELVKLTARPYKIYRSKNKKKLDIVQKEAHAGRVIKRAKVAFVPVAEPKKPAKITVSKSGKVSVKQRGVIRRIINLDPLELARDAVAAVEAAIAESNAQQFGITAGEYQITSRGAASAGIVPVSPREVIAQNVAKLVAKYGADKFNEDDPNSHYFGNWLFGLIAYEYENFRDLREYRAAYERQRQLILKAKLPQRLGMKKAKRKKTKRAKK